MNKYWSVVIFGAAVSALNWLMLWLKPFPPTELSVRSSALAGFLCILGGLLMAVPPKGRAVGVCGVIVGLNFFALWLWKRRHIRNADLSESK